MPSLTHDQLVDQQKKKFSKDWIVLSELVYGGYKFDLFAFNPITKEIEIVEVDISAASSEEKIAFAETLGTVKICRNIGNRFRPKSYQLLANAIGSPVRLEMLETLTTQGGQSYSDLLYKLKMIPNRDTGRFAYHLKLLLKSGLVATEGKKYIISEKGVKTLDFLKSLQT